MQEGAWHLTPLFRRNVRVLIGSMMECSFNASSADGDMRATKSIYFCAFCLIRVLAVLSRFSADDVAMTALACHIRSSLEGDAFSREVLQCARKAGFTFDPGVGYR